MKRLITFLLTAALCLSLCGCGLKDSVRFELPDGRVFEQENIDELHIRIETANYGDVWYFYNTEEQELISKFINMLEGLSFEKVDRWDIPDFVDYRLEFSLYCRPDENGVSYGSDRVMFRFSEGLNKPLLLWVLGPTYYIISDGYWSEEEWTEFLESFEYFDAREIPPPPETIEEWTPNGWVTKPFGSDYPIGSAAEDGLLHGIDIDFPEGETVRLKDIYKIAYRIDSTIKADYLTENPELISELLTMLSETEFSEPIIGEPDTKSTIKFSSKDSRIGMSISIEEGIIGGVWSKQHKSYVYYHAVSGFWSENEWNDFFTKCED